MSATLPHRRNPPALAMAAIGALVFLGCGAARLTGFANPPPPAPIVQQISLHFTDMPDGTVHIIDAATSRTIDIIPEGKGAFLRSTMRVMATERANQHLGRQAPFTLQARADSRLQLIDTATGQTLELEAFGPSNEAAFEQILTVAGGPKE